MINWIKKFLGVGEKKDLGLLINNGAIIVDVRTKQEFADGHIKNSLNIPLDELKNNLKKLKSKEQPIVLCCRSGMRSASAKGMLEKMGYTNVYNAGSWNSLKRYEKQ